MKNIFHHSFNAYKTDIEPRLNDVTLHSMQCSRRLFEIQLSHRRVSAAYIEGDNVAVTVEGEAAYVLNFDTGKQANGTPVVADKDLLRRQEVPLFAVTSLSYSYCFSHQGAITEPELRGDSEEDIRTEWIIFICVHRSVCLLIGVWLIAALTNSSADAYLVFVSIFTPTLPMLF